MPVPHHDCAASAQRTLDRAQSRIAARQSTQLPVKLERPRVLDIRASASNYGGRDHSVPRPAFARISWASGYYQPSPLDRWLTTQLHLIPPTCYPSLPACDTSTSAGSPLRVGPLALAIPTVFIGCG